MYIYYLEQNIHHAKHLMSCEGRKLDNVFNYSNIKCDEQTNIMLLLSFPLSFFNWYFIFVISLTSKQIYIYRLDVVSLLATSLQLIILRAWKYLKRTLHKKEKKKKERSFLLRDLKILNRMSITAPVVSYLDWSLYVDMLYGSIFYC